MTVLTLAKAWAAGADADTGLLSPPMVDNKPVNVEIERFLTELIDVDEVANEPIRCPEPPVVEQLLTPMVAIRRDTCEQNWPRIPDSRHMPRYRYESGPFR